MSKLYQLNKDELVKLVETIQQDLKKELEFCKDQIEMYEYMGEFETYICFKTTEGCKAMWTTNFRRDEYRYCEEMTVCKKCRKDFCDKHGNISRSECLNCILNINLD